MPEQLVCDTVVLSNFTLAGALDLLASRYGTHLICTHEVMDELAEGISAGCTALQAVLKYVADGTFGAMTMDQDQRRIFVQLLSRLGAGEASCIAVAGTGATVATDDRAARICCAERQIACTGTIGILKAACLDETLSGGTGDKILDAMIASGFYSPVNRITDIL